jgi:hypothetical protein
MNPAELTLLERRFRRAYELARLKSALWSFGPSWMLVLGAGAFGGRLDAALAIGPLLFAGGVLALWYGREPGRGVLPGVIGGGAALVLILCANRMGHLCIGDRCLSWCVPACITAGVLAGGLVSFIGVRQQRRWGYWLSASGITLLTGALGCSCVGYSGMASLAVGFVSVVLLSAGSSASKRREQA